MKIQIAQEGDVQAVGIHITAMDQMISSCHFFICVWSTHGPDEIMKEQVATAIILRKPFILAVEKGATVPDELRQKANIIHEIEWTRGDPKSLAQGIEAFLKVVQDIARGQKKLLKGEDIHG